MKKNIFAQTLSEVEEFKEGTVHVAPGYDFSQYETIKRIHLYQNSKFESGDTDSEGFQKHFYNIANHRCDVAKKAIDLDVKDIKIVAERPSAYYDCWFLEKELRQWMKEARFGRLINRLAENAVEFGSAVIKEKEGNPEDMIVDLRNFFVDQSANYLKDARFIIERHFLTPDELRQKSWDNKEEIINQFETGYSSYYGSTGDNLDSVPYIPIWERVGEVPESWLVEGGDEEKFVLARFIIAINKDTQNNRGSKEDASGVVLFKEKLNDIPYREYHWKKILGRWLGRGVREELFVPQIRMNEVVNLQAKALWWTALHLYQTRDDTVNRNLLQDAQNGEILTAMSEIIPIQTEERNLATYQLEIDRWERLSDNISFSHSPMTGERQPAGTPLGSTVLQAEMAGGFFDLKREEFGMFIKDILVDLVIPKFEKEKSPEHILNLTGSSPEDLSKLNKLRLNAEYNDRIFKLILEKKDIPTMDEALALEAAISEHLKAEDEKIITIPENFYKDLKYKVDIVVTGERIDLISRQNTLMTILQVLAGNPDIIKDEQLKSVFFKLIEAAGVNPADFEVAAEEPSITEIAGAQGTRQGGSIAKPTPPPAIPSVAPTEEQV